MFLFPPATACTINLCLPIHKKKRTTYSTQCHNKDDNKIKRKQLQ